MGSKKGQLFLVAIVFLIGVIFIIQQALFQYSSLEMAKPFKTKDIDLFMDTLRVINETIKNTYYCNETKDSFEDRMEELRTSLLQERRIGRSIDIVYELNCSNWDNVPPDESPLKVMLRITGPGRETSGNFEFYHKG